MNHFNLPCDFVVLSKNSSNNNQMWHCCKTNSVTLFDALMAYADVGDIRLFSADSETNDQTKDYREDF